MRASPRANASSARAGEQAADEDHRAEDVEEEREVPAVRPDRGERRSCARLPDHVDEDQQHERRSRARASASAALRPVEREQLRARPGLAGGLRAPAPSSSRRVRRAGAPAGLGRDSPEHDRRDDPAVPDVVSAVREREPDAEDDRAARRRSRSRRSDLRRPAPCGSCPSGVSVRERRRSGPRRGRCPRRTRTRSGRGARGSSRRGSTARSYDTHSARAKRDNARVDATARHLRAPDRDDRGRQLVARPAGGARARREQGRGCARHGRVLRLPLRRARGRARPARDARDARRGDDADAADAAAARASPASRRPSARR